MPESMMKRIATTIYEPQLRQLPEYGKLLFDHLCAEYSKGISHLTDPEEREEIERIKKQRAQDDLAWKDIYCFEQLMLRHAGLDELKRKIKTLRSQFRNIAGAKDYDVYLAAKPPDLETETNLGRLQQDSQFLLNEFYLRYSLMSAREHMRNNLLKIAALMAVVAIITGGVFTYVNFNPMLSDKLGWGYGVTTLAVVMFVGIVGALISMQQRIQSAASEGDPIYIYSMLTHGRFGVFLSPISGAVFSVALYMMFTGGLLSGKIFPTIATVEPPAKTSPAPQSSITATTTESPLPTSTPMPKSTSAEPIFLNRFLKDTGPATGIDYALLVIWAFIAGFAERFVPDALNRLVARSDSGRES